MNLPNLLSLLRIILVTPFLIALIYKKYPLALAIFAVAGITDYLDGFLARRLGQKSVLGSFLDPIGDKLMGSVSYITLSIQGLLPAWLAVIIISKDVYVALGTGILHYAGHFTGALPSRAGKLSTTVQILTILAVLFNTFSPLSAYILNLLFAATAVITIIACLLYVTSGIQAFRHDSEQ